MTNLIIDANNMCYRAKYSFDLSYMDEDTSMMYGFFRMLLSEIERHAASSVIVCWDYGIPAYRKELIPHYKAGRHTDSDPDERKAFYSNMDAIARLLPTMGAISLKVKSTEADDIIYHASRIVDGDVVIVSTDADMLQTITSYGRVKVWNPHSENMIENSNFEEFAGFPMNQLQDYRALLGDKSDNIAGVPGIGKVMAKDILECYPTLDIAYDSIGDNWIPRKLAMKKLSSVTMKYIDDIRTVMNLDIENEELDETITARIGSWNKYNHGKVKPIFFAKGFVSLMSDRFSVKRAFGNLVMPEVIVELDSAKIIIDNHK